jgi:predicted transcriptional regulator of viral defense system
MSEKRIKKAKEIFEKQGGIVKSAILRANKFCSKDITELVIAGYLSKIKTGYYIWIHDNDVSDLAIATAVVNHGVICLLSAAQFHELTTVNAALIDVAIPSGGKPPLLPAYPPIQLHRFKISHFDLGISKASLNHVSIRIYDKERTICDLFRMRNQYGMDIALEALKSYMNGKDVNIQKLYEYAEKMRIKTVIMPYVEVLL